jgi:cysteine desulfurase / selenocysteine lyase
MLIDTNIRNNFPIIDSGILYFDSASSTLKPRAVIEKVKEYYTNYPVNIHRGLYKASQKASYNFEASRKAVQKFINARSEKEIIVTKGTTEAINFVASTWGEENIQEGDVILVSQLEHHSNILPWTQLAKRKNASVQMIPLNQYGEIDLSVFEMLLTSKVKLIAVTYASNVIGSIPPVRKLIEKARIIKAKVLLDAAQSIAHCLIDVQSLDCDFLCFSGHKMYGPSGVGILYGKEEILETITPYQVGGGMVKRVELTQADFVALPYRLEGGTPPIASMIALKEAIDFIEGIGRDAIQAYENSLLEYFITRLPQQLERLGNPQKTVAVCSLFSQYIHAHDLGSLLAEQNIAVRVGHHCAFPLMEFFKVPATLRVSFAIYNNYEEIDTLINNMYSILRYFHNE